MGNSSNNIQSRVMGFQLCTMSICKKHAQQVMHLARNALKSIKGEQFKRMTRNAL